MSKVQFKKATKTNAKGRFAVIGPAGSGKTYHLLQILTSMCKRVAIIDTEHGSASKYANLFNFDVLELESFSPQSYCEALYAAEAEGYDGCGVDSLSHAWMGKDGVLEMVDSSTKSGGSKFSEGWRKATPEHNKLVEAMLQSKMHLGVTMRTKVEYVMEKDERTGKTKPVKVGLQPVQREGLDYEFDVTADLDHDNVLTVDKTRCPELKGKRFERDGEAFAAVLLRWLTDGAQREPTIGELFIARYDVAETVEQEAAITNEVVAAKDKLNGDRDKVAAARRRCKERLTKLSEAAA